MARYNCEVFGVIRYSLEISYHELYEVEEELIQQLTDAFGSFNAQHLDFWGYGDFLQLQCELADYETPLFTDICDDLVSLLPEDVAGQLLFVDKRLTSCAAYFLSKEGWREKMIDFSSDSRKGGLNA